MIPDDVIKKFEEGRAWAGANQTMRLIDSNEAKIVLIADDVQPEEIVKPIKLAVTKNGIEHYFATKKEIAKIVKCPRPASAACLV